MFKKKYFEFKQDFPGGGGIYIRKSDKSIESFTRNNPIISIAMRKRKYVLREISREAYEDAVREMDKKLQGGKVVNIDKKDAYSKQVLQYHEDNLSSMVEKGFTITRTNINNLIKKYT